jgi:hypothetical protein
MQNYSIHDGDDGGWGHGVTEASFAGCIHHRKLRLWYADECFEDGSSCWLSSELQLLGICGVSKLEMTIEQKDIRALGVCSWSVKREGLVTASVYRRLYRSLDSIDPLARDATTC